MENFMNRALNPETPHPYAIAEVGGDERVAEEEREGPLPTAVLRCC